MCLLYKFKINYPGTPFNLFFIIPFSSILDLLSPKVGPKFFSLLTSKTFLIKYALGAGVLNFFLVKSVLSPYPNEAFLKLLVSLV